MRRRVQTLDRRARPRSYRKKGWNAMASWKDPEIAGVRALLASRQPPSGAPAPTRQERRAAMDAFGEMGSLPPGCRHEPLTAGGVKNVSASRQWALLKAEAILYLHGGGYIGGSPKSHRPMVARLADAARAVAIAADYRLAPEHTCPAALDDALSVYRWMLDGGAELGRRIIVAGGLSPGGGLTMVALALALKDAGLPQPVPGFL